MPFDQSFNKGRHSEEREDIEVELIADEEKSNRMFEEEFPHRIKLHQEKHVSLFGRFVFLLISWIAFCWSCLTAFFFVIYGVLALITGFRHEDFVKGAISWWTRLKGSLAVVVGTLLAVFSPVIGIGVITLYFATREQSLANDAILRMFYDRLRGSGR